MAWDRGLEDATKSVEEAVEQARASNFLGTSGVFMMVSSWFPNGCVRGFAEFLSLS